MPRPPAITIDQALERLLPRLQLVETERLPILECGGRVLAEPVVTDRPSPALDVSAMDGFAVRAAELQADSLPIIGECRIGHAPESLPASSAMRIFTGSPLPSGADTVLKVEDSQVDDEQLTLAPGASISSGQHIRYQAENSEQGRGVLSPGRPLTSAAVTATASLMAEPLEVYSQVKVGIITTGNELLAWDDPRSTGPEPWQLRDSNGPALASLLYPLPWVKSSRPTHAEDSPEAVLDALQSALAWADAVVFTGGVSMGDHDYVPKVVAEAGGETLFHGLKIRPGKPMLGALVQGKPVLGLPGNPVSVLVTARRLLAPVLRQLGGFANPSPAAVRVILEEPGEKTLPLEWHRPVTLTSEGQAKLCTTKGSGDVIGVASSDGFVAVPPEASGPGPYAYFRWEF